MDDWYILDRKSTSDIEYEVECMERKSRGVIISSRWKKGGEELVIKVNLATREVVGNTDVCNLKWSHINGQWLDFPRVKTGVARRSYLWPETKSAIDEWYEQSIESEYVCQGVYGQKLGAGDSNSTPIAHLFSTISESCKIDGRGFYALRHTYRTIADGAGDEPAVYLTMGHSDNRIGANYRHRIEDSRLIAVSEFVRAWVCPNAV